MHKINMHTFAHMSISKHVLGRQTYIRTHIHMFVSLVCVGGGGLPRYYVCREEMANADAKDGNKGKVAVAGLSARESYKESARATLGGGLSWLRPRSVTEFRVWHTSSIEQRWE